jgi:cobyrinic acid a,c-diamide synthase
VIAAKNPNARVVATAVTLESVARISAAFASLGVAYEATLLNVTRYARKGGYHMPDALSANTAMLSAIRRAITDGLPTIAECGGYMYLHEKTDGTPLVGIIAAEARRTDRLQHFGYAEITAQRDNLLCRRGESIRSHEFHYCESTDKSADFLAQKPLSQRRWYGVTATETLYAGFPHLYFPANPAFAENFIRKVNDYAKAHRTY